MVHNGIEYGVMQLIAETYDLLRRGLGLPPDEVAGIFAEWNRGPLESYLIDVAAQVLAARDPETGNPLVEMIFDQAGQKGTAPELPNLLLDADVRPWLSEAERGWRRTVSAAVAAGIPVPAMSAALAYFDSYRSPRLPQNLTQARRDFFGAHTYQRVDRPDAGFVHTDWRSVTEQSAGREAR